MSVLENSLLSSPKKRRDLIRSVSDAHRPMSKSHHHIHHHPHLPGHRRREHSASPQIRPGSTSVDHFYDPKHEGSSPHTSRRGSRRPSFLGEDMDGNTDFRVKEMPPIKPGQVRREKEKSALRAIELRESLMELNTLSNNTTRQLDNTYYSVLEKHSVLQSTIASMRELALAARKLDQDFKNESNEMVSDIDTQLNGFKDFTDQRQKIEGYAGRIKTSREKVTSLCERLEVVRARVEKWEKNEGEWQESTRRRLRILWTVMITCVLIFAALLIFQYAPMRSHDKVFPAPNIDFDVLHEGEGGNSNMTLKKMKEAAENGKQELDPDPRLRIFDEL